jgi:hypothetical protein
VKLTIGWGVVLGWAILSLVALFVQSPGIYSDPAWGIFAAEQHHLGISPDFRTARQADPSNLQKDIDGVVSWWSPLYQGAPYVFRRLGLSWGHSVQITVLLSWVVSALGWGLYFARWRPLLNERWMPWLILMFLMFRYSHGSFHMYDGGEFQLLAAFPWVLLLNMQAMTVPGAGKGSVYSLLAGMASAGLFLIKYSSLLLTLGLGAAWLMLAVRHSVRWNRVGGFVIGSCISFFLIHAAGVPGGQTPADPLGPAPSLVTFIWPWSSLPLAMTDLDSLLRWLFIHPTHPILTDDGLIFLNALVLGMVLVFIRLNWNLVRRDSLDFLQRDPCLKAIVVILPLTILLLLIALLLRRAAISVDARHLRIPALLLMPWLFCACLSMIERARGLRRIAAALFFAGMFVVPAAYGGMTLVDKAFRRSMKTGALVNNQGIRLDLLGANANAREFHREIMGLSQERAMPLYFTSPDLALDFADCRIILRLPEFMSLQEIAEDSFRGVPEKGVGLVLPDASDESGRLRMIQDTFRDVHRWERIRLTSAPGWSLWIGKGK